MATTIDINFDTSSIKEKALSQILINRQSFVDRQEELLIEKEAQQERKKTLSQQGKNLDGSIKPKSSFTLPVNEKKVAANRWGAQYIPVIGWFKTENEQLTVYSTDRSSSVTVSISGTDEPSRPFKYGNTSYRSRQNLQFISFDPEEPMFQGFDIPRIFFVVTEWEKIAGQGVIWDVGSTYNSYYYDDFGTIGIHANDLAWAQSNPTPVYHIYDIATDTHSVSDTWSNTNGNTSGWPKVNSDGAVMMSLPVNQKSFIFYFANWSYKIRWYSGTQYRGNKWVSATTWSQAGAAGYTQEYPTWDPVGGDYFPLPVWLSVSRIESWYERTLEGSIDIIDTFNELIFEKKVNEYCFVVTERTVKQIDPPSSFAGKIHTIWPLLANDPTVSTSTYTDSGVAYTASFFSALETESGPAGSYESMKTVGLGEIRTNQHFSGHTFTPGIFTVLDNASGLKSGAVTFSDYPTMYDNYLKNISTKWMQKTIMVDSEAKHPQSQETSYPFEYIDVTGRLQTLTFSEPVIGTFSSNRKAQQEFSNSSINGLTPIIAWDWGDPAYCSSKLQQLGFNLSALS